MLFPFYKRGDKAICYLTELFRAIIVAQQGHRAPPVPEGGFQGLLGALVALTAPEGLQGGPAPTPRTPAPRLLPLYGIPDGSRPVKRAHRRKRL